MHGTFFAVEEHLVAIVSTSLFCVYPGHDLMSLLYHFMDEFLFVFSAEPFFIARVCTKNKNSAILNNLILTVFCISHATRHFNTIVQIKLSLFSPSQILFIHLLE